MKFSILIILLLSTVSNSVLSQVAILGQPLKKEYVQEGPGYEFFYQTGETVDSYSMICDMGQAIPDSNKENWYVNKPISGLKLELRARLAIYDFDNNVKPMGFVVVVKDGDVLVTFSPIGDWIDGVWEGDTFNSWSGTNTDIEVFSERFGRKGYARFDLLDGNGFFYKSDNKDQPDYFLSSCKRIKKTNLPVYDWR